MNEELPTTDLGPYRLEKLLGRGGMGAVYQAVDQRLGRKIAIKHVRPGMSGPETRRKRFRREAATLARLSHPAIVQIFDLVETEDGDWIVMELVDGPTLSSMVARGSLPIRRVLEVGRQVAEGLAEAHDQGILHRDLKTENVILGPSGAKILDFGLAKLFTDPNSSEGGSGDEPFQGSTVDTLTALPFSSSVPTPEDRPPDTELSATGQLIGTFRSMSPEQARGLDLDPRSDLFSFGLLLYEMVLGRPAFRGVTSIDTLVHITSRTHVPVIEERPEVPPALSNLIDRLLEKEPEDRPDDSHRVVAELQELETSWRTSSSSIPSVPTTGSPPFEEGRRPRRRGPGILVGLSLLTLLAGFFLWEEQRRTPALPTATIPEDVASEAAPLEPYELFTQAMGYLERFDKPGHLTKAVSTFEKILALDENSAAAHAGLARAYWLRFLEHRDPLWLEQAVTVAEQAVLLEEHLAFARIVLGTIYGEAGRYEEALQELEVALRLSPDNADAYRGLGVAHRVEGKMSEAIEAYEKAVELRPEDRFLRDHLGTLYFERGRYQEAEAQYLKSLEIDPDWFYGYRNLAGIYILQGRIKEAADTLQKALTFEQKPSLYSNLGTLLFAQGLYEPAAQAFQDALDHGGAGFYLYWANLGDAQRLSEENRDKASEAYTQAIRLARAEWDRRPDHPVLPSRIALYLAKMGKCLEALDMLSLHPVPDEDPAGFFRVGVTREICGEREKALHAIGRALDLGYPQETVARDPELFSMRADPRYHRLLVDLPSPINSRYPHSPPPPRDRHSRPEPAR